MSLPNVLAKLLAFLDRKVTAGDTGAGGSVRLWVLLGSATEYSINLF